MSNRCTWPDAPWRWVDRSLTDYFNWARDEPDDSDGTQNCWRFSQTQGSGTIITAGKRQEDSSVERQNKVRTVN